MTVTENVEKRNSRRAFFTLDDNISTNVFSSSNGGSNDGKPFSVTLLSISVGGLSVTARRQKFSSVKPGDRLIFTDIQTPQPLGTIEKVEAVVKYVVADDHSIRMALGCEFDTIPELYKEKIDFFINERLIAMGLAY